MPNNTDIVAGYTDAFSDMDWSEGTGQRARHSPPCGNTRMFSTQWMTVIDSTRR